MWKLECINWDDIKNGRYDGDIASNTYTDGLFTKLEDVWNYLGFRLKRERCGYSGMMKGTEFRLTKENEYDY